MPGNQKYKYRKNSCKHRINRFIIKQLNENRFFLWTKFLIKIKTRGKKKLTKKSHWGSGGGGGGWAISRGHFFQNLKRVIMGCYVILRRNLVM